MTQGIIPQAFLLVLLVALGSVAQALASDELKAGVVKVIASVEGKTRVGTGIIIRVEHDAVHVVTASHVIEGDPRPQVEFFTRPNRPLAGRVIGLEGGDPRGLAALLVEGDLPEGLQALTLDPSIQVNGGEAVTLIGFPRKLGTAWAVTTGSISGLRGRDIAFQAPADEGNSGGPLIMNGKVVGVITESRGQFAYAVPAIIAQFALSSWGITVARAPAAPATPEPDPSADPELSELERLEAAIREGGGGTQPAPPQPPAALDVTGLWSHATNPTLSYAFEQRGDRVTMAEITTTIMGSVVTAQGEGQLVGRRLRIGYITSVGTSGQSVVMVSEDGESMSGTFTDTVSGLSLPITLSRSSRELPGALAPGAGGVFP